MSAEAPRTHRVLAAASRQELLAVLRRAGTPVSVPDAADAVGLHRNTVRFHLDLLVSVGLAERVTEQRSRPGRPKVLYRARPVSTDDAPVTGDDGYRALARLLADHLAATPDAARLAQQAGRNWCRAQAEGLAPAGTGEQAAEAVRELMGRLGFDPAPGADGHEIVLRRCPYAELAREQRPVVCGVHLGMIEGTLEQLDAPVGVAAFEPFAIDDPLRCVITLTPYAAGTGSPAAPTPSPPPAPAGGDHPHHQPQPREKP